MVCRSAWKCGWRLCKQRAFRSGAHLDDCAGTGAHRAGVRRAGGEVKHKTERGGHRQDFDGGDLAIRSLFSALPSDLIPVAIHHGYLTNSEDLNQQNINERVHWSVIEKGRGNAMPLYNPCNLPADIPAKKIAAITDEERGLLNGDEFR